MKTSWTPLLDMQLHPPLMDPAFMQQNHLTRAEKEEHAQDNPALSTVIERNIRTIINLRERAAHERSFQARIADVVTAFSGRMVFVYVHIIWFGSWILLNTGRLGVRPFDPFPYGLLTMVVSLEAIFLATLVLISQNRLNEEAGHRADLAAHGLVDRTGADTGVADAGRHSRQNGH